MAHGIRRGLPCGDNIDFGVRLLVLALELAWSDQNRPPKIGDGERSEVGKSVLG